MAIVSHLHHLFHPATCQAYIPRTLINSFILQEAS
jgi:hypothetical protein